jgi:hypothetical protein
MLIRVLKESSTIVSPEIFFLDTRLKAFRITPRMVLT